MIRRKGATENSTSATFDAGVISSIISGVSREMGVVMERSTNSRYFQARDMVTGILSAEGTLIAQAEYIPLMAFALTPQVVAIREMFGSDIHEGDVFIASDVYFGGNQALDLGVFVPIFHAGCLVLWACAKGHVADLGGGVVGGYNLDAHEVWQENVRIPPLRIESVGGAVKDVWALILSNSRLPDRLQRDIHAMQAACERGKNRMVACISERGPDRFSSAVNTWLELGELAIRGEFKKAISPTGFGTAALSSPRGTTLRAALAVTVDCETGSVVFDFAGSDDQEDSFVNSPLASTVSTVLCAIYACLPADIPHNGGCLNALEVRIPEGSFLNPISPSPAQTGNFTANNAVGECVLRALATILPGMVTAGWCKAYGSTFITNVGGRQAIDSAFFNNKGGSGACLGFDGFNHIGGVILAGGSASNCYERFEAQNALRILSHQLWTDSGGAGTWRGGLGTESQILVTGEQCLLFLHGDSGTGAHGANGGCEAPGNEYVFRFPDGRVEKSESFGMYELPRGTIVANRNGGGGGFGDPLDRPAETVRNDVAEGLVSLDAATHLYGERDGYEW